MDIYTIEEQIVHETKADFRQRCTLEPVHIMQYDNNLPIIAVKLFQSGYSYTLPENAECEVRWGKPDHTFVYKPVLGCNEARNTVYVEVDNQMTYFYGMHQPIIELKINGKTAGSSYIRVMIDKNPIQEDDIESHCEYYDFDEAVKEVEEIRDEIISVVGRYYTKEELTYLLKLFCNHPADYIGTTAQIEALETDRGLALSTDNNIMYYWSGERYKSSHLYYKQPIIEYGTTEFWNSKIGYRSTAGHILVYSDYSVDSETGKNIPNIKIADGTTYVQDLPFCLSQVEKMIQDHISDSSIHVSARDREFWNNKINCEDIVVGEALIINRN